MELASERVGLITYMRTDSVRLSNEFINSAKDKIISTYGDNYYKGYVQASSKDKNVQDAHEAIRPSKLDYTPESIKKYLTNDEFKLYNLIYTKALASLMSPAIIEDEKIKIDNNGYIFEATGERIKFDGYLCIYHDPDDEDTKNLPEMEIGEELTKTNISSEQKFTNPPTRYSEGRIINKMKELGIGRPSTYAQTVETLKNRLYVKIQSKALVPTEQGMLTSDRLNEYFNTIINVKYTASMEDDLDKIAEGNMDWHNEIRKFYDDFMPLVKNADEKMEKIYPVLLEETCPECGKPLVKRNGRFGEFIACSGYPNCHFIKKKEPEVVKDTGIICPLCHEGHIVERISKKGRSKGKLFYACDRYPNCKTTYSSLDEINNTDTNK